MGFFSRTKKAKKGPEDVYSAQNGARSTYAVAGPIHPYENPPRGQYQHHGNAHSPPGPPAWMTGPPPHFPPSPYGYPSPPPPAIMIQNNYHVNAPAPSKQRRQNKGGINKLASSSMTNLVNYLSADLPSFVPGASYFNNTAAQLTRQGTQYVDETEAIYDAITAKFEEVLSLLDSEAKIRNEEQLLQNFDIPRWQQLHQQDHLSPSRALLQSHEPKSAYELSTSRGPLPAKRPPAPRRKSSPINKGETISSSNKPPRTALGGAILKTNLFSKSTLYANSTIPGPLPKVQFYISTLPLLVLAAQASEATYLPPSSSPSSSSYSGSSNPNNTITTHIPASISKNTKTMSLTLTPLDNSHTLILSIRGSAGFFDWLTNFRDRPASPAGFLLDAGNLCHEGFLRVAQKMVGPVARRIRQLLREDRRREGGTLVFCGHSAGGAVAALLFVHMLSVGVTSELGGLRGAFGRVHCFTFGAPTVSLLPLMKPEGDERDLFLGFVNEGDPVPRLDFAYFKSLVALYGSPAPAVKETAKSGKKGKKGKKDGRKGDRGDRAARPTWPVPPGTLSLVGKIVLLREREGRVQARLVSDEMVRKCVWGDLMMHEVGRYRGRIEQLAVRGVGVRS